MTAEYLHEVVGSNDVIDARNGSVGKILIHDKRNKIGVNCKTWVLTRDAKKK